MNPDIYRQRLIKKSIPQLKKLATEVFNEFIRKRDKDKGCISCGKPITEAGHFYSAGAHPGLRYDEMNVHGQETSCNRFKSGNLLEYRQGLINRYGEEYIKRLEIKKDMLKRSGYKWDRTTLIAIILKYKLLNQ